MLLVYGSEEVTPLDTDPCCSHHGSRSISSRLTAEDHLRYYMLANDISTVGSEPLKTQKTLEGAVQARQASRQKKYVSADWFSPCVKADQPPRKNRSTFQDGDVFRAGNLRHRSHVQVNQDPSSLLLGFTVNPLNLANLSGNSGIAQGKLHIREVGRR